MNVRQCLGGWCRKRENCDHYTAEPIPGLEPSERLCEPGKDEPLVLITECDRLAADPRFAAWVAAQ